LSTLWLNMIIAGKTHARAQKKQKKPQSTLF